MSKLYTYQNVPLREHNTTLIVRQKEIVKHILEDFLPPQPGDEFIVIDPFIEFTEAELTSLIKGTRLREWNTYLWFLLEIGLITERGKVRMLSKKHSSRGLTRLSTQNIFMIPVESIDGELDVRLSFYTDREIDDSFSNLPRKLHDRWILRKRDNSTTGLHLGGSLTDIDGKDVTLTTFTDDTAALAAERFEDLWRKASNGN